MDSKELLACYPRRTFYPLSDNPSTQDYRITMTNLSLLLDLYNLTVKQVYAIAHLIRNKILTKPTFVHLRYFFGDDRPSQTTHHTLFLYRKLRGAIRRISN